MKKSDIDMDIQWTDEPVIGQALMIGGEWPSLSDSFGDPINPYAYYHVGRVRKSESIVIIPDEESKNKGLDNMLRISNKLN